MSKFYKSFLVPFFEKRACLAACKELNKLSDKQLFDIGIARDEIYERVCAAQAN